jgi:acyl dehydratase
MSERTNEAAESAWSQADHKVAPQRWFEDFTVGETYHMPSRTMSDAHFAAFQVVSGDNHPSHYDIEHCRANGYDDLLAHGLQVASFVAVGAGRFAHEVTDSLIAFLDQSSTFLKPVLRGDTLYPRAQIVELIPQRTTGVVVMRVDIHNHKGVKVLEGTHRYLIRKRSG